MALRNRGVAAPCYRGCAIVCGIAVRDGDRVAAGQVLLRLDGIQSDDAPVSGSGACSTRASTQKGVGAQIG